MLAIFDIDGTICDTQEVEGKCYANAIRQATGISLETLEWTAYPEPTSSGIVRHLLADDPAGAEKEEEIKHLFVDMLGKALPKFPGDFSPLNGAVEFLDCLKTESVCSVAIATGGFDSEAEFKLNSCGISLHDFPHATSSDTPKRQDIISLAAKRAGFELSSIVYFGDAPWDLAASRALGIPMIGIGRRTAKLQDLGLKNVFRDYSKPRAIVDTLKRIKALR